MPDLFPNLGKYGLGGLKDISLYDDPTKKGAGSEKDAPPMTVYCEEDFLFEKAYVCPICDHNFNELTVRAGKVRPLAPDQDLRPKYEQLDVSKYDVVSCPQCGYTVLRKLFGALAPSIVKLVKSNISDAFIPRKLKLSKYSYEAAYERYQLCLLNAIVKRAKDGEKAYICLKTAWLMRGMAESLDKEPLSGEKPLPDPEKERQRICDLEVGYLHSAFDGFVLARAHESYPICGLDESTLDYLLATLALRFKDYDVAAKMISGILMSKTANHRMKDKARDLKDILLKEKSKN